MNRILFIYSLFQVLTTGALFAQNLANSPQHSQMKYVFKLSENDAIQLHQTGFNDHMLHTLVDSFAYDSVYALSIPGNFLTIWSEKEQLNIDYQNKNFLTVDILDNQKNLVVQIRDTNAAVISDAFVYLKDSKLDYNHKLQAYQKKSVNKRATLLIKHNGVISFYDIKKQHRYKKYRPAKWHFIYNRPFRYVAVPLKRWIYDPIKYSIRLPYDSFQSIKNGRLQGGLVWYTKPYRHTAALFKGRYYGMYYRFMQLFSRNSKSRDLSATFILDKPTYRLGDTVRFKAMFWEKGDPWSRKNFELKIEDIYGGGERTIAHIQPFRKGSFCHSFVLADSLGLSNDNRYQISLQKGKYYASSNPFEIADYELKNAVFELNGLSETYNKEEAVSFSISSNDQNKLPLLDARLSLKLTAKRFFDSDSSIIYYSNILWEKDSLLSTSGITKFSIPQALFPDANMRYSLIATFRTSDNETVSLHEGFTKNAMKTEPCHFTALLENDSCVFANTLNQNCNALMTMYFHNNQSISKTINLPYKEKIRQNVSEYVIRGIENEMVERLTLSDKPSYIQLQKLEDRDSCVFSIENPRKLLYAYQLYKNTRLIEEGSAENKKEFRFEKKRSNAYFLRIQYVWAGSSANDEIESVPHRKKLYISIDSISPIYPAQKTDFKLKVIDHKGKPVKNADLLAFAQNSKLESSNNPTIQQFGDLYASPKQGNSFELLTQRYRKHTVDLDMKNMGKLLNLSQNEFYKFLYPGKNIYKTTLETENSTIQFAPYLLKDGEPIPVYYIFNNYQPIYFCSSNNAEPYLFTSGQHIKQLRVRYSGGEAIISDIHLAQNGKTIISIDIDSIQSSNVTIVKKENYLSKAEVGMLERLSISVDKSSINDWSYIKQGNKIISLRSPNLWAQNIIYGPVRNVPSNFISLGELNKKFTLETGCNYTFSKEYFKLEKGKINLYPHKGEKPPFTFTSKMMNEYDIIHAWHKHIEKEAERSKAIDYTDKNPHSGANSTVQITLQTENTKQLKYYLLTGKHSYPELKPSHQQTIANLKEGDYQIIFFFNDTTFIKTDWFNVKDSHTTVLNIKLKANDFKKYTEDIYCIDSFINPPNRTNEEQASIEKPESNYFKEIPSIADPLFDPFGNGILIKGTVVDDMGPLIQATVIIKGTSYGTVTDFDGQYAMYVPNRNSVLVFSYVGLGTQEHTVYGNSIIDIILKVESKALKEAIVIGYGTQKKEDLTSAITQMAAEDIADRPVIGVDQAMQGKAAGVQVTSLNGAPGAGVRIRLREEPDQANIQERYAALRSVSNEITSRTYFSDCAFWEPELRTDKNGIARFTTTMPGNITMWKTFFVAKAKKRHTGISQTKLNAYKPIVAELSTPRFLLEGDSCGIIAKTKNYLGSEIALINECKINDSVALKSTRTVDNIAIDTLILTASNTDSIQCNYTLKTTDNYTDGETRKIPVLEKGTVETIGQFAILEHDSTISFTFDSTAEPVSVYAESDELNIIKREAEHIRQYEYLCNEQLASKLKAALILEQINKQLGKDQRFSKEIISIIKKLNKRRNDEGLWGWWANSPTHWSFSEHVVEALILAEQAGYKTTPELRNEIAELASAMHSKDASDMLHRLILLKQIGFLFDYKPYIRQIDSLGTNTFYEHLQLISLKQKLGLPYSIDTLLQTMHENAIHGTYWGEKSRSIFDNSPTISALAYQILKEDSTQLELLPKIRRHLFHSRTNGHWNNTFESAQIIELLLNEINICNINEIDNRLIINKGTDTVMSFPFEKTLAGTHKLTLTKHGKSPMYLTAYQQIWNKKPETVNGIFRVSTNLDSMKTLAVGKAFRLQVDLISEKEAEYVMVEIPIPASCTYLSKMQNIENGHIEYFKNKICLFITSLQSGKHRYEFDLMPRYSGTYTINPSKAELMYFPTYFGRNALHSITITQME